MILLSSAVVTGAMKYLPVILSGISWVLLYGIGYYSGSSNTNDKWILKTQKETIYYQNELSNLISTVRRQEQEYRDKIDTIVSENLHKQEELKSEYEQTIADLNSGKLSVGGVYDCDSSAKTSDGVSTANGNTANLVCFTKAELYQRLEKSLAITNECDQLAVKYNSLLEVCQTNIEQARHNGEMP